MMKTSYRKPSCNKSLYILTTLAILASAPAGCGKDSSDSEPGPAGSGGTAGSAGAAGTAGGGTGGQAASAGSAGIAGNGGDAGAAAMGGSAGTGGTVLPSTRKTISGNATWTVTFDADAQTAGATECEYTRHYDGVQDESRPWVCAECEVIFRTTVTMPVGREDCFSQVSEYDPMEEEWVGYGNGNWYRSYGISASEQGTASVTADTITTENDVTDLDADIIGEGKMAFTIAGEFTMGEEDGDPNHGWNPPNTYACGWTKENPPKYTGPYTLQKGTTLPDGVFRDTCEEPFRLHDMKGSYLVLFMSAIDCPACRQMADKEVSFMDKMAIKGINVHTVTLMAPSLSDPFGNTSTAQLEYWRDRFNIPTPILADRGWGVSMFLPIYPETMGYPSWVVVDPELEVLNYGTGGDWLMIELTITNHATS